MRWTGASDQLLSYTLPHVTSTALTIPAHRHTISGMATFSEIADVRVRIDDPSGFQAFVEVDTGADLPAAPAPYTAYKIADTGAYVYTDVESGATEGDYERLDLRVADSRIEGWIDADDVDTAECKALAAIANRLGAELRLVSTQAGAEQAQWAPIRDMYTYYKGLARDCQERNREENSNNTGRYGWTDQPEIAGGET